MLLPFSHESSLPWKSLKIFLHIFSLFASCHTLRPVECALNNWIERLMPCRGHHTNVSRIRGDGAGSALLFYLYREGRLGGGYDGHQAIVFPSGPVLRVSNTWNKLDHKLNANYLILSSQHGGAAHIHVLRPGESLWQRPDLCHRRCLRHDGVRQKVSSSWNHLWALTHTTN